MCDLFEEDDVRIENLRSIGSITFSFPRSCRNKIVFQNRTPMRKRGIFNLELTTIRIRVLFLSDQIIHLKMYCALHQFLLHLIRKIEIRTWRQSHRILSPVEVNVLVEYIMYKENKLIIHKLTHLQQTL